MSQEDFNRYELSLGRRRSNGARLVHVEESNEEIKEDEDWGNLCGSRLVHRGIEART